MCGGSKAPQGERIQSQPEEDCAAAGAFDETCWCDTGICLTESFSLCQAQESTTEESQGKETCPQEVRGNVDGPLQLKAHRGHAGITSIA